MTIESGRYELDSADIIESTQKLVAVAREKHIQKSQWNGNQAVSQTILSTTHDLSVVVPTRNERANIWPLLESLRNALCGLHVEVIFVDDSDDDTPEVIEDAARTMSSSLFQIQLEHRVAGEARTGGLATAVVEGLNRAQADYVAVLDADLQHPPEQLRMGWKSMLARGMLGVLSLVVVGTLAAMVVIHLCFMRSRQQRPTVWSLKCTHV